MTWLTARLFRIVGKLRGQKKSPLTSSDRRKLIKTCSYIAGVAEKVEPDSDGLSLLEACTYNVVSHLDKTTRDKLFATVNIIVDAKQHANQQSLATSEMLDSLIRSRDATYANLVAKYAVDSLLEVTSYKGVKQSYRNKILKAVVARLVVELPHKDIKQIVKHFKSDVLDSSERESTRGMYE